MATIYLILYLASYYVSKYGANWWRVLTYIGLIAGAMLIAITGNLGGDDVGNPVVATNKKASAVPNQLSTSDVVESLTKLKDLLDKGIITQEEFDNKRKDILG